MAPHAESPRNSTFAPSARFAQEADGLSNGLNTAPVRAGATDIEASPLQGDVAGQANPNILYIMADQMAAPLLKMHDPDSVIRTPHIDALSESGVTFDSAYCNSPLCAPSRFCMVSGQLPSKIRAYDNASTFASDIPTFAHYLRRQGYATTLAGKMHFIGADQLHGFENRLTSDIYPGDFGWSVNWESDMRQEWYHNMSSVHQAGPAVRTNQMDFDEEVIYKSSQYLYDYAREDISKRRPFCLTVSMTHPHDPYAISQDLWDLYEDTEIPLPKINVKQSQQDPHSQRILKAIELWGDQLSEESIKRARRAYYGACTYVDNNVGKLLDTLKRCGLSDNTIIVFSGDHGDMLGERGMWYKMSWFEMSARVPLIVNYPKKFSARRVSESVSIMDMLPTIVDLVGGSLDSELPLDGRSFYPALVGHPLRDEVIGEYMGEGTVSPIVMIRRGQYKYVTSLVDPPQLFDLKADLYELDNLATSTKPEHERLANAFAAEAAQRWDLRAIHDDVLHSQRQRKLCWSALKQGAFTAWDYQPVAAETKKYVRSTIPLNDLERRARYPPVDANGRATAFASPVGAAGAANE